MNLVVKITAVALAGAALGLTATSLAVTRGLGFAVARAGPWRGMPQVPATGGDPYASAVVSRSGQAPLGSVEGMGFTAMTDSKGARLTAACDYRVTGAMPSARFWTIAVSDRTGHLVKSDSGRYGFTSSEILRDAHGGFDIHLAREARAGNWLPLGMGGRFTLALRLYDTPHSLAANTLDAAEMPQIIAERCS